MPNIVALAILAAFIVVFAAIQLYFIRALVKFFAGKLHGPRRRLAAVALSLLSSGVVLALMALLIGDVHAPSVGAVAAILLALHLLVFARFDKWGLGDRR